VNRIKVRIGWLVALGLLLLAGAIWLALREPTATEDAPATNSPVAVQRSRPERRSRPDTAAEPVPVTPAAVTNINPPPRNAAELYEEAFAALKSLTDIERCLLWDLTTNGVAPELCAKLQPAIELLHQTTTHCDWSAKINRDTYRSYQDQYEALHKALLWSAAHCRAGDPAGMRDDLLAALRAGPHFACHPFVHDMNTNFQLTILDFVAERARSLPAATLAELAGALEDGSYEVSFYRTMGQHAKNLESDAASSESDDPARAAQWSGDAAAYRDWLTKLRTASVNEDIPTVLVSDFASGKLIDMVKWTQSLAVRRAMTAAALRVLIADASVLAQYPDPATGQPFQYQATETGFALTSGALLGGKPVTMNFRK